jgi:hypothetical protein
VVSRWALFSSPFVRLSPRGFEPIPPYRRRSSRFVTNSPFSMTPRKSVKKNLISHGKMRAHVRSGCRQSMPSKSIDSCAGVTATEPLVTCGQTKRPRSSRCNSTRNATASIVSTRCAYYPSLPSAQGPVAKTGPPTGAAARRRVASSEFHHPPK